MTTDILTTLRLASSVQDFLAKSHDVLIDINLDVASSTLKEAQYAINTDAQVWSVINYLKIAEAGIEKNLENFWYKKITNILKLTLDIDRLAYVRALMAACYKYLGEEDLMENTLSKLENDTLVYYDRIKPYVDFDEMNFKDTIKYLISPRGWLNEFYRQAQFLGHLLNPKAWKDTVLYNTRSKRLSFNYEAYIEELKNKRRK